MLIKRSRVYARDLFILRPIKVLDKSGLLCYYN